MTPTLLDRLRAQREAVYLRLAADPRGGDSHNCLKLRCPRGHLYHGANLYLDPRGHRRCRLCAKISDGRRRR